MDDFLKSLAISKDDCIEDILEPCSRILLWLQNTSLSTTYSNDLELILKGTLFLNECFRKFDNLLELALIHHYAFRETTYVKIFEKLKDVGCISYVCEQIFKSNSGRYYIPFIEKHLNFFLTSEQIIVSFSNVDLMTSLCCEENSIVNRKEMLVILQKIFELQPDHIDTAIKRLLENTDFDTISYILIEPKESAFYTKCLIVEDTICELLKQTKINYSYFRSMYILSSTSKNGLQLVLKTFKSTEYSTCLVDYFVKYLSNIIEITEEDVIMSNNSHFQNFDTCSMLFLITSALGIKSPCRTLFYKRLFSSSVSESLKEYLNKLSLVFDF